MLNSKQRAQLRGMANTLPDTLHIGKDGVTEGVLRQLEGQGARKRDGVTLVGRGGALRGDAR